MPDVPTLDELAYRGVDVTTWCGLVSPKGSPPEVVHSINSVDVNDNPKPCPLL